MGALGGNGRKGNGVKVAYIEPHFTRKRAAGEEDGSPCDRESIYCHFFEIFIADPAI
jgi:hypothetical protein